ncbi:hypothetical protein WJX74_008661 [Apatococcus lobatus]|uniref:Protein kinase domain-containing protein n=1 Tax=Apatococcus lobatus TaxID=904363 RepID=A0AAW1RQB4_9CHLO
MALVKQSQDERLKLLERRLTGQELSTDACEQLTSLLLAETSQEAFVEPSGPSTQPMDATADLSKRRQSRGASSPRKKRRSLGSDAMSLDAAVPKSPSLGSTPNSADLPSIGPLAHSYRATHAASDDFAPASPPPEQHQTPQHLKHLSDHTTGVDAEATLTQQLQLQTAHANVSQKPRPLQKNKIDRYFPSSHPQTDAALMAELQQLRQEKERMQSVTAKLQAEVDEAQAAASAVERKLHECRQAAAERERKAAAAMLRLAGKKAQAEGQLGALQLQQEGLRLGRLLISPSGPLGSQEVWEDGQAFRDLAAQMQAVAQQRETIEAARKAARKKLPPPVPLAPRPANQMPDGQRGLPAAKPPSPERMAPDEYVAMEEIFKVKLGALKREEERLGKEQERLDVEKARHIRELKRRSEEETSQFGGQQVLKHRYLLLHLLGKGGFSEVFKAFDLQTLQEVAVKLHQLSTSWPAARKASYVRHAVREYEIHKGLRHTNIVALEDIFEINANTFATVLELCTGGDLDTYLKENQVLPEKEARVIAAQVLRGLAHLNHPEHKIIHYDLKPANCLFDAFGQVKITDFGLSKIVEDGQTRGMELTSQGAGTYWYLPPECFETGTRPPLISNKVDVWAVGIILFQMLFGKRPFGEGSSQEAILQEDIILHAKSVSFPGKPAVSAEAKDFISRCLAYRQQDRLDVQAAASHPYMALKRPKTTPAKPEA